MMSDQPRHESRPEKMELIIRRLTQDWLDAETKLAEKEKELEDTKSKLDVAIKELEKYKELLGAKVADKSDGTGDGNTRSYDDSEAAMQRGISPRDQEDCTSNSFSLENETAVGAAASTTTGGQPRQKRQLPTTNGSTRPTETQQADCSSELSQRKKHRTDDAATLDCTANALGDVSVNSDQIDIVDVVDGSSVAPDMITSAPQEISTEEIIRRLVGESSDKVAEGVQIYRFQGKSLNEPINQSKTPLQWWANDRYEEDAASKTFLSDDITVKRDAEVTLKALRIHGADPYLCTNGQTPLSTAVAGGHVAAVAALLDQVPYKIHHLQSHDSRGDTVAHCAVRNKRFACLDLLLDTFSPRVILEQALDSHGENVLFTLVRETDIPYDQDASPAESKTLVVLKKLLGVVKTGKLETPLTQTNENGETVLAVAAMAGCLHEVKELTKIEFGCGRSISNHCSEVGGEVLSPLDLAKDISSLVKDAVASESWSGLELKLQERRVGGNRNADPRRIANWTKNGLDPVIRFLEEIQKPKKLDSLRAVSRYGRDSMLTDRQVLTEQAKRLQRENASDALLWWEMYEQGASFDPSKLRRLEFVSGIPKCCKDSKGKNAGTKYQKLRTQVKQKISNHSTGSKAIACVIKDPKDPCVRSLRAAGGAHYGVFASDDIENGTVVFEYSGMVRREDEDGYDTFSKYIVKSTTLDKWSHDGPKYLLDAGDHFNEASFLNDYRHNVLDRDNSELGVIRTPNVAFVEVKVDDWPHMFVVTTRDIKSGSELLLDYGVSYWTDILKQLRAEDRDRIEKLLKECERYR